MASAAERKALHKRLDEIVADAKAINPDWTDKHLQADSAAGTLHMVIDDLHDLTPYQDAGS